MNKQHAATQKNTSVTSPLTSLVLNAGMVLLHCDVHGKLVTNTQGDWLTDLLTASPIVRLAITAKLCKLEFSGSANCPRKAFQGVWLVPVRNSESRRGSGFAIGVLVTDALCTSEYLHALCQASSADTTVIRDMVRSLKSSCNA